MQETYVYVERELTEAVTIIAHAAGPFVEKETSLDTAASVTLHMSEHSPLYHLSRASAQGHRYHRFAKCITLSVHTEGYALQCFHYSYSTDNVYTCTCMLLVFEDTGIGGVYTE